MHDQGSVFLDEGAGVDLELSDLERLLDVGSYVLSASWRVNRSGEIVFWSPENHVIYGTDSATFVPTAELVYAMMESQDRERMRATFQGWREEGKPFAALSRIVRATGERRVVEIRGWVETGSAGTVTGLQGITTDVTQMVAERQKREALSEQRDVILRATGDAICGVNVEGRITFSNPALWKLLGRPEAEVTGARLHDLAHRDTNGRELHEYARCTYARYNVEPSRETDSEFRRCDGTTLDISYERVSVTSTHFDGVVLSLRDITERLETARRLTESLAQVKYLSAQRGTLLRSLVAAEEDERSRIAADLHDDTVQTLCAVVLRLTHARTAAPDARTDTVLASAEDNVRAAVTRLRFLLFELLPPVTERNLRTAIEAYCKLLFSDTEVTHDVVGNPQKLPLDCYLLAYRLTQEALRNVLKHAQSSRVKVNLKANGNDLTIHVCDNGVGFKADAPMLTSAGLRIIRRRAQAAGGNAQLGTGLDHTGASITLQLPLRPDFNRETLPAQHASPDAPDSTQDQNRRPTTRIQD